MNTRERNLRRVKAILPGSSKLSETQHLRNATPATPILAKRLLRIIVGNPWDDYEYFRDLGQVMLAKKKFSYLKLVNIKQFRYVNLIAESRVLSNIQHPNIASIQDIYWHNDEAFLISEYLNIGIGQLELQSYELEEWEIATIIAEVIKGVAHISSLKISCKELSKESIRFSLDGEIKLVLDPENIKHDPSHETPRMSQVLLEFPILAEIIEDMMLSRYHLISYEDEGCSEIALDFLSCTLTGTLETLMHHQLLSLAVSPRKMIPRIRFALEVFNAPAVV